MSSMSFLSWMNWNLRKLIDTICEHLSAMNMDAILLLLYIFCGSKMAKLSSSDKEKEWPEFVPWHNVFIIHTWQYKKFTYFHRYILAHLDDDIYACMLMYVRMCIHIYKYLCLRSLRICVYFYTWCALLIYILSTYCQEREI